jgi:hypothetical protein
VEFALILLFFHIPTSGLNFSTSQPSQVSQSIPYASALQRVSALRNYKALQASSSNCTYIAFATGDYTLTFCDLSVFDLSLPISPSTYFTTLLTTSSPRIIRLVSATFPKSLVNFVFTLQLNNLLTIVHITCISTIFSTSLSIGFHRAAQLALGTTN